MKEGLKMKDRLHQLLDNCIETGSEVDLSALAYLLEGFEKKIIKGNVKLENGNVVAVLPPFAGG